VNHLLDHVLRIIFLVELITWTRIIFDLVADATWVAPAAFAGPDPIDYLWLAIAFTHLARRRLSSQSPSTTRMTMAAAPGMTARTAHVGASA
jgi:hypothetical protein